MDTYKISNSINLDFISKGCNEIWNKKSLIKLKRKKILNHFLSTFLQISSLWWYLLVSCWRIHFNYRVLCQSIRKMCPLESLRHVMTWIYIHPSDEDTSKLRKSIYASIAVVYILLSFITFYGSAAYFWEWISVDFKVAFYAIWQIILSVLLFYGMVIMILSRQKIKEAFETLSDIYNESKNQFRWKFVGNFGFLNRTPLLCDFTF